MTHVHKGLIRICMTALFFYTALPVQAASDGIETLRQTSRAFSEVAEKAVPAVVAVQVEHTVTTGGFSGSPFDDDFFERFFGPRFRQFGPREEKRVGQGSGFIISEDGQLLTNYHVVKDADKITVLLNDGSKYEDVEVVGYDDKTDVALLQIKDVKNLPVVELGDSDDLRIGEWVIAIGNPFGLTETVTVGVVSAKGRKVSNDRDVYEDFIQTDAAINPGNSGGPLLNIDGKAIGINSAIITGDRGYMGIGLAIPINMAKAITHQILETGKVVRGWAGIGLQDLTDEISRALDLKVRQGAIITSVEEDSPAEKAGLKEQDIIIEIDGKKIDDSQDVKNIIGYKTPGTNVEFVVNRDGKEKKITMTTGTRPESEEVIQKLGIQVKDRDSGRGVQIVSVEDNSPAARVNLREGMIILAVNRQQINSVKEFTAAMKELEGSDRVALFVRSDMYTFYVTIPLE